MEEKQNTISIPELKLPSGSGTIEGLNNNFEVDKFNGTASLSIPVPVPKARALTPEIALSYNSGNGNGLFGMGFGIELAAIVRKTSLGIPQYNDKDTFVLPGAGDLVIKNAELPRTIILNGDTYLVREYMPDIEGEFSKIEQFTETTNGDIFWKVTTTANIVQVFGKNPNSRISNPRDNKLIYQWNLEQVSDPKGNTMRYTYRKDSSTNSLRPWTQTYPDQIVYGNYGDSTDIDFAFQISFGYGDYNLTGQGPDTGTREGEWKPRLDPFSSFKSGFEIRTEYLCRNILIYHQFKGQFDDKKILTKTLNFVYDEDEFPLSSSAKTVALLTRISQVGYQWQPGSQNYVKKSLPPVDLEYTSFNPLPDLPFQPIKAETPWQLPGSFNEFQLVDMMQEGIPGILYSNNSGHLYWEPEGDGKFSAPVTSRSFPIDRNFELPAYSLQDVNGDGGLELVVKEVTRQGFYRFDNWIKQWDGYVPFLQPAIGLNDSYPQTVDLTNNGKQDILAATNENSRVFLSQGTLGYETPKVVSHPDDFPFQVNSGEQTLLAFSDLFGDGLMHRVRIRNGLVEVWPNLGYGKFGNRIALKDAPLIKGEFDISRILLLDVDGSGTTDIAYVYPDHISIYLNQSGNSFATPFSIKLPATFSRLDQIDFADILGQGINTLIYTEMEPEVKHYYYDPLAQGESLKPVKPYLLKGLKNNLGAEKTIEYRSSVDYYLEDKQKGKPWVTSLPFPVHVVARVVHRDSISSWSSVEKYAYHEGYYDPCERQFKGFGFIESWNGLEQKLNGYFTFPRQVADQYTPYLYVPPTYTRSWFSVGDYIHRDLILQQYASEYYSGDPETYQMPDSLVSPDIDRYDRLTMEHVYQALNGHIMREEVYGLDGDNENPYTVMEKNYTIRQVQERGKNRYPSLLVVDRESINFNYEREPNDPRTTHDFQLQTDSFGNPLEVCTVNYPRRPGRYRYPGQDSMLTTAINFAYNAPPADGGYIHGVLCEQKDFELTNLSLQGNYFSFDEIKKEVAEALTNPDHESGPGSTIINWQRNYFWNYDQDDVLPLCHLTSRTLMHHEQKAIGSQAWFENLEIHGQKVITEADLTDGGGYLPEDQYYWNPGMVGHYYKENDLKFFLPNKIDNVRGRNDPVKSLLKETIVYYDPYCLLTIRQVNFLEDDEANPKNHVTSAVYDYRFIEVEQLTNINGNLSQVLFDPLGNVIVSTQFKPDPSGPGILEGDMPTSDYDTSVLAGASFDAILADPSKYLQKASTFFYYDFDGWQDNRQPVSAIELARDLFVAQDPSGTNTQIKINISYTDGFGRLLETKEKTTPGAAFIHDDDGKPVMKNGSPSTGEVEERYIVSGKVVYNNKGKNALEYFPYFSDAPYYEEQLDINTLSPPKAISYDPLDREVQTDIPKEVINREVKTFFSKTVMAAWETVQYDLNDTVIQSSFYQWFMDNYPVDPTQAQKNEKNALEKAAKCENTPSKEIFNPQGETIFKISNNLGKLDEAEVQKLVPNLPPAVFDEIWGIISINYLDKDNFLKPDFRPYDPNFQIPLPPNLEQYRPQVLIIQNYLAQNDLTARLILDIKGRTLEYIDPRFYYSNVRNGTQYYSSRNIYELVSDKPILSNSPDGGPMLGLRNMFDDPFKVWDARGFLIHTKFDRLQRFKTKHVSGSELPPKATPPSGWTPLVLDNLVETIEYGEGVNDDYLKNLRGEPYLIFDQAGKETFVLYTLKGKPVKRERVVLVEYKEEVNWLQQPALQNTVYSNAAEYNVQDQLLKQEVAMDGLPYFEKGNSYSVSGQLVKLIQSTFLNSGIKKLIQRTPGSKQTETLIDSVEYYPNGQPIFIQNGNGIKTFHTYEKTTQRLISIRSLRETGDAIQDIGYTYDPEGNITRKYDDSFETIHCYGQKIEPMQEYTYSPMYQVTHASGRQHSSVNSNSYRTGFKETAYFQFCPPPPNDSNKLLNYLEVYSYDFSGNLIKSKHTTFDGGSNWTTDLETGDDNNQLTAYSYDQAGNPLSLYENQQTPIFWNYRNRLSSSTQLERPDYVNDSEYYVYNSEGNRVRRVVERLSNGSVQREERIYLDEWEIYRKLDASSLALEECQSFRAAAEKRVVAQVNLRTVGGPRGQSQQAPSLQIRFQLSDILQSSQLELDAQGKMISYEEYFPYGGSSLIAGENQVEVKLKYYRFSGMERDDTTGLYYVGSRYYAPWQGRWLSVDPEKQYASPYTYAYDNPIAGKDPDGQWGWLIPIIVGGIVSAYTAYRSGSSKGKEGTDLVKTTAGGLIIGAVSGGLSVVSMSYIAPTAAIAISSTVQSFGLSKLTGGDVHTTTSLGVVSYDWTKSTLGYLFKSGNTKSENLGYFFGLLNNIPDVRSFIGGGGENVELITEFTPMPFDKIGHSAIVSKSAGIDISVGPDPGGYYNLGLPVKDLIRSLFDVIKGQKWPNYLGTDVGWTLPLYNLNKNTLVAISQAIAKGTNPFGSGTLNYSGIGWSCVDYTSSALWRAGIPNIPLHPYLLHAQIFIRQIGISMGPSLITKKKSKNE